MYISIYVDKYIYIYVCNFLAVFHTCAQGKLSSGDFTPKIVGVEDVLSVCNDYNVYGPQLKFDGPGTMTNLEADPNKMANLPSCNFLSSISWISFLLTLLLWHGGCRKPIKVLPWQGGLPLRSVRGTIPGVELEDSMDEQTRRVSQTSHAMGVEPKIGVKPPQNGWFIMENPIKMDDLGGPPLFLETPL